MALTSTKSSSLNTASKLTEHKNPAWKAMASTYQKTHGDRHRTRDLNQAINPNGKGSGTSSDFSGE